MQLISIIIPCYNSGDILMRSVNSVLYQTYKFVEIILVNDGSNDSDTIEAISKLPPQVKIINQENKGLSAARNAGIRASNGEYILTLDCDDYLQTTFLDKALEILNKDQELVYVFSHIKMFGEKSMVLERQYNFFVQLFTNQLPYCLLMKKVLWEKVGGYDEDMKLGFEDWEFNIRLGKHGYKAIGLGEPLFNYFASSTGMMKSTSDKNYISILRYIRRKHKDIYCISGLYAIWKKWNNQHMPYPSGMYILMYIMTEILPGNTYNLVYKGLSFIKQSERFSK